MGPTPHDTEKRPMTLVSHDTEKRHMTRVSHDSFGVSHDASVT